MDRCTVDAGRNSAVLQTVIPLLQNNGKLHVNTGASPRDTSNSSDPTYFVMLINIGFSILVVITVAVLAIFGIIITAILVITTNFMVTMSISITMFTVFLLI